MLKPFIPRRLCYAGGQSREQSPAAPPTGPQSASAQVGVHNHHARRGTSQDPTGIGGTPDTAVTAMLLVPETQLHSIQHLHKELFIYPHETEEGSQVYTSKLQHYG